MVNERLPNTPAQKTAPVIDRQGRTLFATADDLYSEPMTHVIDAGQREWILPSLVATAFGDEARKINAAIRDEIRAARQLINHPKYMDGCIQTSNSQYQISVMLGCDVEHAGIEGTPMIQWNMGLQGQGDGWELVLTGMTDLRIFFAAWDDRDGIQKMVDSMFDQDSLLTMVALLDPARSSAFTARKVAMTLRQSKSLRAIRVSIIDKLIKDNNLTSYPDKPAIRGTKKPINIKVDGKTIPVAIAVWPPAYPRTVRILTMEDMNRMNQEQIDQRKKEQNAAHLQWRSDFKNVIESTEDWRFAELSLTGDNQRLLIVTRIPERLWESLAPAAAEVVNTLHFGNPNDYAQDNDAF